MEALEREEQRLKTEKQEFIRPKSPEKEIVVVPSHVHIWKNPSETKKYGLEAPILYDERTY